MRLIKLSKWDGESARFAGEHCSQNPYLPIDADTYGVTGKNVDAWKYIDESGATSVLAYRYYNSFQLLSGHRVDCDALRSLLDLFSGWRPEMIQGPCSLLESVDELLPQYCLTVGRLYEYSNTQAQTSNEVELASNGDFLEIAELICADEEIGIHYSPELLSRQFAERARLQGCRNMVLRRGGKIVAHMATYGEADRLAVLGGLKAGTGAKKGDGALVLDGLAQAVACSGKRPFLYCYIEHLWPWYEARGWQYVSDIAKLEPID